jgi:MYXO-CTERM domain-containing protein
VGLLAACSGTDEKSDSTGSALAQSGRWTLPSAVRLAGAKVRLTYDDAPAWTNAKACGGKLKPGGRVLGEYLMDRFAAVTSVGGYSCRQNTANKSKMSVHGTGRALDVFVPKIGGAADNGQGDKVANWLVENAQEIGVQLVIWDRSIWRANGTNDAAYGGPHPHDDHLHVELTTEAAAQLTLWFDDNGDAGTDDDAGMDTDADTDTDPDTDPDTDDASTTPEPDAAPPPVKDAGAPDVVAPPPPPVEAPDAAMIPGTLEPEPESEQPDDAPGETDSLPNRPARTSDPASANAGCSTAPARGPTRSVGAGLALMLGLGAWLRRKRR